MRSLVHCYPELKQSDTGQQGDSHFLWHGTSMSMHVFKAIMSISNSVSLTVTWFVSRIEEGCKKEGYVLAIFSLHKGRLSVAIFSRCWAECRAPRYVTCSSSMALQLPHYFSVLIGFKQFNKLHDLSYTYFPPELQSVKQKGMHQQ